MRLVMIDTIQADSEGLHRQGQGGLGVELWSNLRRRIVLGTLQSNPEMFQKECAVLRGSSLSINFGDNSQRL